MPEREDNIMTREAGDFKLNQVENQKDEEITDSKDKNTLLNTENKKLQKCIANFEQSLSVAGAGVESDFYDLE
ncbi:MAG TPA: hypothetical protein DDY21_03265 [Candidatus Moranbacteria bacterium]|nr:hypothetical protein [Candidatus Moranbacteria bacterium]HCO99675.1 hypothetical protein [Candidatus Moranbacteria bacterium]